MIVLTPHTGQITALAFSPDGRSLASVSTDSRVKVWDTVGLTTTARPRWDVETPHRTINHAQFSPDGRELFTGGTDATVRVWDAQTGRALRETEPDPALAYYGVNAFVVSPDGAYLAWGGGSMYHPSEVAVARTADMAVVRRLTGHDAAVGIFAAYRGGFASGSADRTIRFWDWETDTCRHVLHLRGVVRGLAVTGDGTRLATAGGAMVHLRPLGPPDADGRPGPPGRSVVLRGHTRRVQSLEFSADGKLLATTGMDSTIRVWDVASAAAVRVLAPKLGPLHWVAFAPDGLTLAFSSHKGHVGLLDVDA